MNFTDQTPFPTESFLKDFLHNDENKNALNEYLATKFIHFHQNNHNSSQILIVSYKNSVLCCNTNVDSDSIIELCQSEETDSRVIRHVLHAMEEGFEHIVVRTIDRRFDPTNIKCIP